MITNNDLCPDGIDHRRTSIVLTGGLSPKVLFHVFHDGTGTKVNESVVCCGGFGIQVDLHPGTLRHVSRGALLVMCKRGSTSFRCCHTSPQVLQTTMGRPGTSKTSK